MFKLQSHLILSNPEEWDKFVQESANGTIFHKFRFLSYHKQKFPDVRYIIFTDDDDNIICQISMGLFEDVKGNKIAKSPFGASYGGFVIKRRLNLIKLHEVIEQFKNYIISENIKKLYLTITPLPLCRIPDESLRFALFQAGFKIHNIDVCNAVSLIQISEPKNLLYLRPRVRTKIRKALKEFEILQMAPISDFYPILLEDKKRHNYAVPTHSEEELSYLMKMFPDQIYCDVAYNKSTKEAAAGLCYFINNENSVTTFYIAQKNNYLGKNPLIPLIHNAICLFHEKEYKIFDFGTSSVNGIIFEGVMRFKDMFSNFYFCRETYCYETEK